LKLDTTDRKILGLLQQDGRVTNSELARQVGLAAPSTLERVRKLEAAGVIRRYAALLDPAKVGVASHTLVEVTLRTHTKDSVVEFMDAVDGVDEIMECHHVTGDADFLLKIACRDIGAYEELVLHRLTALPHVANLKTMVVLSTLKHETAYNLEANDHERE
jgi:DNA-binding Lrp family transcriptional regulator